jgi:hypothetical protein
MSDSAARFFAAAARLDFAKSASSASALGQRPRVVFSSRCCSRFQSFSFSDARLCLRPLAALA